MSEKAAPFGLSVTAADKFYDAIATSLDLPRFAGAAAWRSFGREISPRSYARGVFAGTVMYGIEATYIARGAEDPELIALQTRPQHEPASCEEGNDCVCGKHGGGSGGITPEPKRPPLAYFSEQQQRAKFDPFAGFSVTSDCAVESQPNGSFRGVRLDGCESFKAPRSI